MPELEQPAGRVWRNFIHAKAEIGRVIHRKLRCHGLTGAQLRILHLLAGSGNEGVKLNEISHGLFVTSGNVTGLIDRLEEAGYLERLPHPEDRRITLAKLTSAGHELYSHIYPAHKARIEHLLSTLTIEEQIHLAELLGRLAHRAKEMTGEKE